MKLQVSHALTMRGPVIAWAHEPGAVALFRLCAQSATLEYFETLGAVSFLIVVGLTAAL